MPGTELIQEPNISKHIQDSSSECVCPVDKGRKGKLYSNLLHENTALLLFEGDRKRVFTSERWRIQLKGWSLFEASEDLPWELVIEQNAMYRIWDILRLAVVPHSDYRKCYGKN